MKKQILIIFFFICSPNIFAQYPDWVYHSKVPNIEVIAGEANYIWVGTHAGVVRINKTTGTRVFFDKTNSPIPDSWVTSIVVDNNGNKWFGTWDKGYIIKFDNVNWTIYDTSGTSLDGHAIHSMAIDNNNNLWITRGEGGLIKFDGTNWTNYTTSNSGIPSNFCDLLCSKGNEIWFVSSGVLVRFDGTIWTTFNTTNSNISTKSINKIDKDAIGNIWLLHNDGVEKFDGNTFTVFDNTNTNIMNLYNQSMTIDNNNIIWTGCSNDSHSSLGGIMSFDGTSWTKFDTTNSSISVNSIYLVYADNLNNIWFEPGNSTGLVGRKTGAVFTNYNPSNSLFLDSYVRQIVNDINGNAYLGGNDSYNFSLVKYDWNSWSSLPFYSHGAFGIAVDHIGNLYIKTKLGLNKFDGTNWSNIPNTPALMTGIQSSLALNCIVTDLSGGIWMDYFAWQTTVYDSIYGTYYYTSHEGLAHFDGSNWTTFSNLNSPLPDAPINDIEIDNNNHVWIGTSNGLLKFDGVNWTIFDTSNSSLPTNFFDSFVIDSLNNIWFSNGQLGLYKFDLTNITNYPYPSLNSSGGKLAKDIDGSIWENTGLDLIHFDGTNWTTFSAGNSPIPNFSNTTALSIDKYGNKWLGTQFGVLVYKQGGVILSTKYLKENNSSISVYPNPFTSQTKIVFTEEQKNTTVKIMDVLGKTIKSLNLTGKQCVIEKGTMSNGIYFIQITDENKNVVNKKIIVQ